MNANCPGVYAIVHIESDTAYIGSASNAIRLRWATHCYHLRKGTHHSPHLQNAWLKYGKDAFQFVVLENTTPETAIEREQYWLDHFRQQGRRLYNTSPVCGSQLGFKHSDETKQQYSLRNIKKYSNVYHLISPDGVAYGNVVNLSAFCREHGLDPSCMRKVCIGKLRFYNGWTGVREGCQPKTINKRLKGDWPDVIDPSGQVHHVHNVSAFCGEHQLDTSAFQRVLKGKAYSHKGWRLTSAQSPKPRCWRYRQYAE